MVKTLDVHQQMLRDLLRGEEEVGVVFSYKDYKSIRTKVQILYTTKTAMIIAGIKHNRMSNTI